MAGGVEPFIYFFLPEVPPTPSVPTLDCAAVAVVAAAAAAALSPAAPGATGARRAHLSSLSPSCFLSSIAHARRHKHALSVWRWTHPFLLTLALPGDRMG